MAMLLCHGNVDKGCGINSDACCQGWDDMCMCGVSTHKQTCHAHGVPSWSTHTKKVESESPWYDIRLLHHFFSPPHRHLSFFWFFFFCFFVVVLLLLLRRLLRLPSLLFHGFSIPSSPLSSFFLQFCQITLPLTQFRLSIKILLFRCSL